MNHRQRTRRQHRQRHHNTGRIRGSYMSDANDREAFCSVDFARPPTDMDLISTAVEESRASGCRCVEADVAVSYHGGGLYLVEFEHDVLCPLAWSRRAG